MGKFDGFLICSDIDGTFRSGEGSLEENINAVKYFTENGGRFTFSTGRMVSHLYESALQDIINAPACLCNGGIIYDYANDCVLRERCVDFTVEDFIKALDKGLCINAGLYLYNRQGASISAKFSEAGTLPREVLASKPVKLVCAFVDYEDADRFKRFALKQKLFESSYIAKSWKTGVEFNSSDATKGYALDFIKNHIGNIHTAIGIGDYENDIPLLMHADIGVAVGNALEEVKQIADMVVKSCAEFAIKDLIEILDNQMMKRGG